MSQDLLKWFKEVVDHYEQEYTRTVTKPTGNWMILDELSLGSYVIGLKKLVLEKDVIGFKQQVYKAGKYKEWFILAEPYNTPDHPRYIGTDEYDAGTADQYGGVFLALISQHPGLIESHARLLGFRGEEADFEINGLNAEWGHLGFAMKYLVLHQDEKAWAHLAKLGQMERDGGIDDDVKRVMAVLKGILNGDSHHVHESLERILAHYREEPEDNGILMKFYANEVAGLGWVAQYRGIAISLNDPLCPNDIFQSQRFDYPSLEWVPPELKERTWRDLVR